MSFEDFCGSPIWDEFKTWNTSNPDFTPCFQKTVFVWVPCGFLWIFTPLQLRFICRRQERRFIPWTIFNGMKLFSCLILIVCSIFRLIYTTMQVSENYFIYPVDYVYPSIEAVTYLLVLILNLIHVRVGIHSSTLLLFFWLLQTITGAVRYRTVMMKAISEMKIADTGIFLIPTVEFPFIFAQLILSCFADTVLRSRDEEKNPYPVIYASPVSLITYAFYDSIAWKGFKRPLLKDDLWALNKSFRAEAAFMEYERIENALTSKIESKNSMKKAKKQIIPSLTKIIWQMIKWNFITGILVKYVGDLLAFVSPLMLNQLINFVTSDEPMWKGILYSLTLFLATSTGMLCTNFHFYTMQSIGIKARAAVISAIYRKTLRMSSAAKRSSTVGEIVTLMSVDAQRIMDLWQYLGHAFSMPIQVTIALALLWNMLGISVLVGLLIIILIIPINGYVANITSKYQVKLMKQKDQRTKLMNEILGGMKILKLYAWETPFYDEVNKIRTAELVSLKKILLLNAFTSFFFQCAPFMVSLSTFATFVLSDPANILDAATAFVSLSLFDIMRVPLNFVPMVIAIVIQSYVSVKRIDKFMANEDLDPDAVLHQHEDDPINIKDGTFSWSSEDAPVLKNINFKVSDGQLIAVIGSVGAGKSSLISSLLGEMEKIQGYVNTRGTVAYVAQQAWIQNATLRENISFGLPLDTARYQKIIEACALKPDLEILPGGDMTEIGEKGINLSGGQKQRVSLARAVYRNCDIYLLDDPLSAVDAHVGKHIFENIIGPNGLLKHKTRILVTHGIAYLPYVDSIAVLVNGTITEMGSYKSLIQSKGAFADFIMTYLNEKEQLDEVEAAELLEIQDGLLSTIGNENVKRQISRRISRALSSDDESPSPGILSPTLRHRTSSKMSSVESLLEEKESKIGGKLIQEEQMEIGKVDWTVYLYYFRSMGVLMSFVMLFSLMLSWSSSVGSNIWLSFWSNDQPLPDGTQDVALRDLRLGVYGSFGIGQALFSLIGSVALAWGAIRASRHLHNCMLLRILRCPMSFFDTTPLGRIVNRFSRDVDATDYTIPSFLRPVLDCFYQIIGTVIVISLGTPIFLVAFIPLGVIYYFIQRLYIDSSRQLKRLESVSRSPIYSHFSETIAGIMTVRAYKMQNSFTGILENKVDDNDILYYPILTAKRWLGVRLEGVGDIVVLFAALFSVLSRETLEPGVVGLSISYSLSVTFILMWLVRNWTDLESNIVSVERMKEYSELDSEPDWHLDTLKPKALWPNKGEVQFQDYSTRYREGLDLVLRGISCNIHTKEKVGIVGRTGAGKSSLTLSLFRIIEAVDGSITIDGIDISLLGLHDLRSRLTIIPQDPVLFCGTLRLNLDPIKKYSDDELWEALEHSHLKEFVSSLPAALEHEITEGGENLSVGQRQLVCLARALLRKTKVLILDEATAAVDLETDDLIQVTIRKEFADCTVITIAHRLNTIMESDRVIVLDQGLIKEFDSPAALLQNKESLFYSMAKDAGLV